MSPTPTLWHPNAHKVMIPQAPQGLRFTGGGKKLVWHTTEGDGIDGAVSAYHAAGVCPHFTIQVVNGVRKLYQHLPISVAASALKHPAGTEPTNTANCIQVEIVGFATDSGRWPDSKYHYLHELARWVHDHYGVPMSYTGAHWDPPHRMGQTEFVKYTGHCGHMHVPGNDHGDPGKDFHPGKVCDS